MNMLDWAKKEVQIACERERRVSGDSGEWNYGVACYESALKAFESLLGDGHSECSIGITKQILNRLIDVKPLTPIKDTDDVWYERTIFFDDKVSFQCKRMSSLFKNVYKDGTVKYTDNDRFICVDFEDPSNCWRNGFVNSIMYDIYPIEMPYVPKNKPYKVICRELLTDRKNGDFDTIGILTVKEPDGSEKTIGRYFKESTNGWEEISHYEYINRAIAHRIRILKETREKEKKNENNCWRTL